jgi:hypothetical protein
MKTRETLENTGFPHFLAFCRNVPKRPEMRASGSTYYRSDGTRSGETDPKLFSISLLPHPSLKQKSTGEMKGNETE